MRQSSHTTDIVAYLRITGGAPSGDDHERTPKDPPGQCVLRCMMAMSRALGSFVICGLVCASSAAFGQGESKKNCGPGRRPGINGCVDAAPRTRLKPEPTKAASDPKPPAPDASMRPPPDERTPAQVAERLLLLRELQQLEALLKATPKNAPERAALLKRIADTYADLVKRAEYDREAQADGSGKQHQTR